MHASEYDAVVVGAGPAGAATARSIARHGLRVLLVEEHAQVGMPCHCSGLVTPRTLALAGVGERFTRNAIRGAVIHSPGDRQLRIGGDRTHALAIDRTDFDRALVDEAQVAGAELALSTRVTTWERSAGVIRLQVEHGRRTQTLTTRLLVGADGAQSRVAKVMGTRVLHQEQVVGLGADVRLNIENPSFVHVFVGRDIAPGFMAWMIPLGGGRARLGIGTSNGRRPVHYLDALRARFPRILRGCEVIRLTGGVIPLRRLDRISSDNVLLVGDAAGHVKPTSGGGIYTALLGAMHCARTAVDALTHDDLSARRLARYDAAWEQAMGAELDRGRSLRKALLALSDRDVDRGVALLSMPGMRQLISRHGDIDFPSRLAGTLLQRIPRLRQEVRVVLGQQRLSTASAQAWPDAECGGSVPMLVDGATGS